MDKSYKIKSEKYVSRNLLWALSGDCSYDGLTFPRGNIGIGEGNSMFVTVTFAYKIYDPSRANKYIASFLNSLGKRLKSRGYNFVYFWVVEKHKRGGFHYHLIVSCPVISSDTKPITTTLFNQLAKDTTKRIKAPIGRVFQAVWTFSRSYDFIENSTTGKDAKGNVYWKDRTPKNSEDDVKGVVNYLVKYLVKSITEYSSIGVRSRAYTFSKSFPLQWSRY